MQKKPNWLKVTYSKQAVDEMSKFMEGLSLSTVCQEANCPNIGECYKKHTATFLVMGENCTRRCRFCNVSKKAPTVLDPNEPNHVAQAIKKLGLKHAVITSVTRDDLEDGGAEHFAKIVTAIKKEMPATTIELLIPDLKGNHEAIDTVMASKPDILGHNIETVPRLYSQVRPQANYQRSLDVLSYVKNKYPDTITKTGIMVGLGEKYEEVLQVMDDIVKIDCDILTIGQYLRPTEQHLAVEEFVTPEIFEEYAAKGREKGISYVYSGPLVRSSYNAQEVYELLIKKR